MKVLYLPDDQGEKLGVDDFLARGHTAVELEPFLRAGLPDPGLFHDPRRRPSSRRDHR